VSELLARHRDETVDHDAGLRLGAIAGPDTVIFSSDGTTTFVGLSLTVSGTTEWAPGEQETAREAAL